MEKKKTAVPAFLGVAAVWIGSHFGPGFATGAFSVRWYVKYGWVGLVTPLLAMFVTRASTARRATGPLPVRATARSSAESSPCSMTSASS